MMERLIKAGLVFMAASMVAVYVIGIGAYVDDTYKKRISDLEKDVAFYDSRNKQLYAQKSDLDAARLSLTAQIAAEQEKAKLIESQVKEEQQKASDTAQNPPADQQATQQTGSGSISADKGMEKVTGNAGNQPITSAPKVTSASGATGTNTVTAGTTANTQTNTPTRVTGASGASGTTGTTGSSGGYNPTPSTPGSTPQKEYTTPRREERESEDSGED